MLHGSVNSLSYILGMFLHLVVFNRSLVHDNVFDVFQVPVFRKSAFLCYQSLYFERTIQLTTVMKSYYISAQSTHSNSLH